MSSAPFGENIWKDWIAIHIVQSSPNLASVIRMAIFAIICDAIHVLPMRWWRSITAPRDTLIRIRWKWVFCRIFLIKIRILLSWVVRGLHSLWVKVRSIFIFTMNWLVFQFIHSKMDIISADTSCKIFLFDKSMVEMVVEHKSIVGSSALHTLPIRRRQCRYINESPLRYYPYFYTKNLCEITCRIQMALKLCGCVPFFYYTGESVQILIYSVFTNSNRLLQMNNLALLPDFIAYRKRVGMRRIANAFQRATTKYMSSLRPLSTYVRRLSRFSFNWFFFNFYFVSAKFGMDQNCWCNVTFSKDKIQAECRILLWRSYGWNEFNANTYNFENIFYHENNISVAIGGTLSLFLGCSFISLAEIVYVVAVYCIRSCKTLRRHHKLRNLQRKFHYKKPLVFRCVRDRAKNKVKNNQLPYIN